MFSSFFLFLLVFSAHILAKGLPNFLRQGRLDRHCHDSAPAILPVPVKVVEQTKFSLFIIFISGLLFFLIFLGMIKGLMGLCCCGTVGMYGLNLLIDLPQPLPHYQEKSLERRPVVYDVGGWPIHPDTHERTVRVLPKRTEFCLNLVFFLAYPLAACVYICAFCCCIKNLRKSDENACFKHVDVVRLHEEKNGQAEGAVSPGVDVYTKGSKEYEDTKYVLDAMQKSKESIREFRVNIKTCRCHDNG